MTNKYVLMAVTVISSVAAFNVQALQTRAGGTLVYDADINLTWTAEGNLFKTLADAYAGGPTAYVSSIITANGGVYDGKILTASDFGSGNGQMNWWGGKGLGQRTGLCRLR